jgi:hypothetical protein
LRQALLVLAASVDGLAGGSVACYFSRPFSPHGFFVHPKGTSPMATSSPFSLVKESFGDKAKLVSALEKLTGEELWVARTNENKGLAHVSNAKLLRLHATFTEVKEKFGTREKLIDAILDLQKRSSDSGLRQKLSEWPVPRLYDTYKSAAKRIGAQANGAKPAKVSAAEPGKPKATRLAPKTAAATKTAKKSAKKTATKAKKAAPKKRSRS